MCRQPTFTAHTASLILKHHKNEMMSSVTLWLSIIAGLESANHKVHAFLSYFEEEGTFYRMGLTALKTDRMLLNHGIFRLPSNKSSQYEVSPPSPEMSWKRTYFLQVASEINGDHIPSSQRRDNWKMSWKVSFSFDINQKLNLTSSCPAIEYWCHLQSAW